MDDNLLQSQPPISTPISSPPGDEKVGFDIEKQTTAFPVLDPMIPSDQVGVDPVPLPSLSNLENPIPKGDVPELHPEQQVPPKPPISPTGTSPVSFSEDPAIQSPSGALGSSAKGEKNKGSGGKKLLVGIAALAVLTAALAGGLYLLKIPGVGELRRQASYVSNSGDCSGGTCTCTSATCPQGRQLGGKTVGANAVCYIVSQHCDANNAQSCHDNARRQDGGSASLGQVSCGTEQIDMGCGWSEGDATAGTTSTFYSQSCNLPAATPTTPPSGGGCGASCSSDANCGSDYRCATYLNPPVCWNYDSTPADKRCGGGGATPTTPPGACAGPGAIQGRFWDGAQSLPVCPNFSNSDPSTCRTPTRCQDSSCAFSGQAQCNTTPQWGTLATLDGIGQPKYNANGCNGGGPFYSTGAVVSLDVVHKVNLAYTTNTDGWTWTCNDYVGGSNCLDGFSGTLDVNNPPRVKIDSSKSGANCNIVDVHFYKPVVHGGQCIDVRAQTKNQSGNWVDVLNNDLAAVAHVADNVRFVARVNSSITNVSFQITSGAGSPQTLTGTLLPDTNTTDQVIEYAAEYTISTSGQLTVDATVQ